MENNPNSIQEEMNQEDSIKVPNSPRNMSFRQLFLLNPEVRKVALTLGIGSLITILTVFLTPLKNPILNRLYKEKIVFNVEVENKKVTKGAEIKINAEIFPTSNLPISSGILKFSYPEESVEKIAGSNSVDIPELTGPGIFPKKKVDQLVLRATKIGKLLIIASLQTKKNLYKDSIYVEVLGTFGKPSQHSLSGSWIFNLGPYKGDMDISDLDGQNIVGKYTLVIPGDLIIKKDGSTKKLPDEEKSGTVEGVRDGYTFKVDFNPDSHKDPKDANPNEKVTKWYIDGKFKNIKSEDNNFIYKEIKGPAQLYSVENSRWKAVGDTLHFYSTISLN